MLGLPQKFSALTWTCRVTWLVTALALLSCTLCRAQQKDVLRLPWANWQWHDGDDPRCAAIHDAACVWQRSGDAGGIDGWYRIEVALPAELIEGQNEGASPDSRLGLLIQGFSPVYEVFVNGTEIGGSGSFLTHWGPQDARAIFSFPSSLAPDGRVLIAVHSLGVDTSRRVGDMVPAVASFDHMEVLKDADTLAYLRRSWQHYLCYVALGGAGFVFFLLFAVNTRLREYAWLGAILGQLPLLRVGELALVVNLGMPSWLGFLIYTVCNGIAAFIGIEFIFAFLGRPVPRVFRAVQLLGAVGLLQLLLLIPLAHAQFDALARLLEDVHLRDVLIGAILVEAFSWLLLVPGCFKSRLPEMRSIGAAVLFITFMEANRQAHNFGLPNIPQDFPLGRLDFDLRPMAYLIFACVMLVAMTFRLRRIQSRNREVEQEMAAAHSVQQILIPNYLPSVPGLAIESFYLPAQDVGGDFFQVLPLGRQWSEDAFNAPGPEVDGDSFSAFIVIGDVSGKGLKAAMTVSLIVGTLRTYAEFCTSPAELLAGLNRRLHGRGDGFATCLALKITPSGLVTLANAAHPDPYLDGVEVPAENNLPLGLSLEVTYSERSFQLEPGQRLTLVTDGVVEATSAGTRELFGFERTQAVSGRTAAEIAEAAHRFGLGAPQADDITVLTIARVGARQSQLEAAIA